MDEAKEQLEDLSHQQRKCIRFPRLGSPSRTDLKSSQREQAAQATTAPWTHDLHEIVANAHPAAVIAQQRRPSIPSKIIVPTSRPAAPGQTVPITPRSFDVTKLLGNAHIKVFLPGMKAPVSFADVSIKQHTRLPTHRPPLRRDKPVRISLAFMKSPRYIFPPVDRSFIFIPRAQRPNQQAFTRGRGKLGSVAGSRRDSVHGGSVYSPASVAISRRSSIAQDFTHGRIMSPASSIPSRAPIPDTGGPVVRLPRHSVKTSPAEYAVVPGAGTPIAQHPYAQTYPSPQKERFRENRHQSIPMHQPKPQKAVSVAGIESPASASFHAPPQQQQLPFHSQLPQQFNGQQQQQQPHAQEQQQTYQQGRQYSIPSQGTPLSNIPERAIHAQPFQPPQPAFQPEQLYPPGYPVYYYPAPQGQPQYPPVPIFIPPGTHHHPQQLQQANYAPVVLPHHPSPQQQQQQQQQDSSTLEDPEASSSSHQQQQQQQANMVAYESNGMTYYYDASQLYAPGAPADNGYAYTVQGMGGMMTPSPEVGHVGAWYQYPQVAHGTMLYGGQAQGQQ